MWTHSNCHHSNLSPVSLTVCQSVCLPDCLSFFLCLCLLFMHAMVKAVRKPAGNWKAHQNPRWAQPVQDRSKWWVGKVISLSANLDPSSLDVVVLCPRCVKMVDRASRSNCFFCSKARRVDCAIFTTSSRMRSAVIKSEKRNLWQIEDLSSDLLLNRRHPDKLMINIH